MTQFLRKPEMRFGAQKEGLAFVEAETRGPVGGKIEYS